MQPTAAAVSRAVAKPNAVPALFAEGQGPALNADAREAMKRSVELRSQLRQQRIRDRAEEASTSEAAFQPPAEQWQSYLEKCGKWSPGGRMKRGQSPERSRLAHQTHNRIFTEHAADVEDAVQAQAGGGLSSVVDYTTSMNAADYAANAAASAALRGPSPGRARKPVVDSHGQWVGEAIEAKLHGAAGSTSVDLWSRKEDNKFESRRLDFLAKAAMHRDRAASGAGPTEPESDAVDISDGGRGKVAGLSSQKLYRTQRERDGLFNENGEKSGRGTSPAGSRRNSRGGNAPVTPPYAWTNESPPHGGFAAAAEESAVAKREVAGLTSNELYVMNNKAQTRSSAVERGGALMSKVAGVSSADLRAASIELKHDASPRGGKERPDYRINSEVKAALKDSSSVAEGAAAVSEIVSNAPAECFDGAAGGTSGQISRARDTKEKRHTNPLVTPQEAKGPVPRLPLKAAGVVESPDSSPLGGARAERKGHRRRQWRSRRVLHLWRWERSLGLPASDLASSSGRPPLGRRAICGLSRPRRRGAASAIGSVPPLEVAPAWRPIRSP
jgi:hypothetical protein